MRSDLKQPRQWKRYAAVGVGLLALAGGVHARRRRMPWKFDRRYHEEVALSDGTLALLRLIRPGDKRLLAAGMRRLSAEGRYRRFHVPKNELTRAELRYFTEVDTRSHLAIGAVRKSGAREGLGIARYVCLHGRPDTAEIAIAVADEMQGKGLGKALLTRLANAARERGIRVLTAEVLATNTPFFRLLASVLPVQSRHREGAVVTVNCRL